MNNHLWGSETNLMCLDRKRGEKPAKACEDSSYCGGKPGVKASNKDGGDGGGEVGGGEGQGGEDRGEGAAESKPRG